MAGSIFTEWRTDYVPAMQPGGPGWVSNNCGHLNDFAEKQTASNDRYYGVDGVLHELVGGAPSGTGGPMFLFGGGSQPDATGNTKCIQNGLIEIVGNYGTASDFMCCYGRAGLITRTAGGSTALAPYGYGVRMRDATQTLQLHYIWNASFVSIASSGTLSGYPALGTNMRLFFQWWDAGGGTTNLKSWATLDSTPTTQMGSVTGSQSSPELQVAGQVGVSLESEGSNFGGGVKSFRCVSFDAGGQEAYALIRVYPDSAGIPQLECIPINGVGPFTAQWQRSTDATTWANVSGATTIPTDNDSSVAELTLYFYRVIVTDTGNSNSTYTSEAASYYNAGPELKLLFAGDSWFARTIVQHSNFNERIPDLIRRNVHELTAREVSVVNTAVSGRTANQYNSTELPGALIAATAAASEYVVSMFGLNDCQFSNAAAYQADMITQRDAFLGNGQKFIAQTPPLFHQGGGSGRDGSLTTLLSYFPTIDVIASIAGTTFTGAKDLPYLIANNVWAYTDRLHLWQSYVCANVIGRRLANLVKPAVSIVGLTASRADLAFPSVAEADSYDVQWDTDPGFSNPQNATATP